MEQILLKASELLPKSWLGFLAFVVVATAWKLIALFYDERKQLREIEAQRDRESDEHDVKVFSTVTEQQNEIIRGLREDIRQLQQRNTLYEFIRDGKVSPEELERLAGELRAQQPPVGS